MGRATTLVARESEHERALRSLRFSGGVLITGPAGVGKTALAAAVAEQLPVPPVGWLVATVASRTTPLGVLGNMLTSRESEVARLAGRGLPDREIADELVLSVRTVQSHLASAYRKLGITSRTELAALRL